MKRFLGRLVVLGLLATCIGAHSAEVKTIDLTPIDGTMINGITTAGGVRFDFGSGYGPGRVWLSSLIAGSTFSILTINSFAPTLFSQDSHFGGVACTIAVVAVPEPTSVLLVLVALGALIVNVRAHRLPVRSAAT